MISLRWMFEVMINSFVDFGSSGVKDSRLLVLVPLEVDLMIVEFLEADFLALELLEADLRVLERLKETE